MNSVPKIMILDNATSSDTRIEQKIQRAMNKLMDNCNCFIIAHHL